LGIATVSNAEEQPAVTFWTATFFVGDGKQTARSNEDERRTELRAVV
jgi:hypothetical protein